MISHFKLDHAFKIISCDFDVCAEPHQLPKCIIIVANRLHFLNRFN